MAFNEAKEHANRNRGTSDWFRHDGSNVQAAPPPVVRLTNKQAENIAIKHRGDTDQWFQHNHKNAADPKPAPRVPTAEGRKCQEKIAGKDEAWFKHEENKDYHSPKGVERLPDHGQSKNFKEKFTKSDSNNWYKHPDKGSSSSSSNESSPTKSVKTPANQASAGSTSNWYAHEHSSPDAQPEAKRMTNVNAEEYLQRNRGSATNWFGHDSTAPELKESQSPRVASKEGGDIAKRLGRESENWFDYDANKDYRQARPQSKGNQAAQDMASRSRGDQMDGVMIRTGDDDTDSRPAPKVRPEAQDIAEKNMQGMMDKFLQENQDYNSARPEPRIKPEATEIAEKNKGVMDDCMQGYLPEPAEHNARRIKPDAEEIAKMNQGTISDVIGGEPEASHKQVHFRGSGPEARQNAERNKGTLSNIMSGYSDMSLNNQPPPPAQRIGSDSAREIAEKYKGTANLIS